MVRRVVVGAAFLAIACEGKAAPKSKSAAKATPAPAVAEIEEAPPEREREPEPKPKMRGMSCPNLAQHVHAVLTETGSKQTKAALPTAEEIADQCKRQRIHAEEYACFTKAKTAAAIDTCNRDAFPGEVDAKPERTFDAKADNAEADPPMFTQDGDYLQWGKHCGLLYRTIYPAGGLFVVCDGKVHIGPIVNAEELEIVTGQFATKGKARRELVLGARERLPAAGVGKLPYHRYDEAGLHQGVEVY